MNSTRVGARIGTRASTPFAIEKRSMRISSSSGRRRPNSCSCVSKARALSGSAAQPRPPSDGDHARASCGRRRSRARSWLVAPAGMWAGDRRPRSIWSSSSRRYGRLRPEAASTRGSRERTGAGSVSSARSVLHRASTSRYRGYPQNSSSAPSPASTTLTPCWRASPQTKCSGMQTGSASGSSWWWTRPGRNARASRSETATSWWSVPKCLATLRASARSSTGPSPAKPTEMVDRELVPVPGQAETAGIAGRHRGRWQLVDALEQRVRAGGDEMGEVGGDGLLVDRPPDQRMLEQRLDLGAEHQHAAPVGPIQGFLTEAVACQQQPAPALVPEGEGEHAVQALEAADAVALQLVAQCGVVVDLAVEDQTFVLLAQHRLSPARGVDESQSGVAQP